MTSIQLEDLALVTGGRGGCQMQQQQQQQQPQAQDPTQAAAAPQQAQGGSFMSGFDQFLSFLQTDSFQQLLGGIRGILGSFGGAQQQAPAAAAAPTS